MYILFSENRRLMPLKLQAVKSGPTPVGRQWRSMPDSGDDDDEETTPERDAGIPLYLKPRKEAVEKAKALIGGTETPPEALRFPPSYDDVYFSDDERLVKAPLSFLHPERANPKPLGRACVET